MDSAWLDSDARPLAVGDEVAYIVPNTHTVRIGRVVGYPEEFDQADEPHLVEVLARSAERTHVIGCSETVRV